MFSLQQKIALAVIAPENLTKLDSPLGVSRGGSAPFCWRSRNQEVPCESLVPFFSQESIPGVQGRGATLQKKQVY